MIRLTPVEDAPSSQDVRGRFEAIDKAPGGVASIGRTMARAPLCLRARLIAATALAVLALVQLASAQPESRISGVVRDATTAGIPGVTVTATNLTTKESRTATTGDDGSYSISVLPSTYSVSAAVQGFRRVVQEVDVSAGAPKPLDFLLDTELTEEVTVTATKREQGIFDVPFSVAAPTEETLNEVSTHNNASSPDGGRTDSDYDVHVGAHKIGGETRQAVGAALRKAGFN